MMSVPKNVIPALEVLGKKLTDAMEIQKSEIMDKINDMFDTFVSRVEKMTTDLKESFMADVKAMAAEIEGIKKELAVQNQSLRKVEEKTDRAEKAIHNMEDELKGNEDKLLKM